jgi:phage terminase large subunit-like protein
VGESLLARATREAGGPEKLLAILGTAALDEALRSWPAIARPEQLEPAGEWDTWLILAGRGFGKTRSGAEKIKDWQEAGTCGRMALIGPTAGDVRDAMIEGESGILSLYPGKKKWERPKYEPSKRRITWPNGAIATAYSAEEPDRLRNKQHDGGWLDELAAWDDPQACWDQYQFGLRLGKRPRTVATTTPRPIPIIRALLQDPTVVVTKGSTFENEANLALSFFGAIRRAYEGTRIGRQEMYAEVLDDNPNALWQQAMIDALRVARAPMEMRRLAIGVDPAVTSNPDSDLTGIVVAGIAPCRTLERCRIAAGDGPGELHAFVFDDLSGIYTPAAWAQKVAGAYEKREADRVIGETNNGGDLVESNLRAYGDRDISYRKVTASRGKQVRAEPISALYEQGRVHHVGTHGKLEDEMTQWDPLAGMRSPSRMDALVWVLTDLLENRGPLPYKSPWAGRKKRSPGFPGARRI